MARTWSSLAASPGVVLLGLGLLCALLLALPGVTVATRSLDELFYTLDGAYRVLSGQVPNRDFHSSLGPLAYYLPAAGFRLSASYGAALPTAMALLLILLSPLLAQILTSRLRPFLALLLGALLILVLAVPMHLGEGVTELSFRGFHSRIGWVAVALLLIMHLQPVRTARAQVALDALCAALLTLLMIYTRIPYGLVALAFLALMLSDRRQRPWAGVALLLVAVTAAVVELFWRGSAGYLRDILMTAGAGGVLRGSWGQIADHLLANLTDLLLFGLIVGFALRHDRRLHSLLFFALAGLGGLWLINHADQRWGIVAFYAAVVVAAETILRRLDARTESPQETEAREGVWVNRWSVRLFALAVLLPLILHCTLALGLHTTVAASGGGRPLPLPGMERVRLANLWTEGFHGAGLRYLEEIENGLEALSELDPAPGPVFVLGGANPFSALLDLRPAQGDMPELRWRATLDEEHHLPPEALFADVEVVLERLAAGEDASLEFYLPYVEDNFEPVEETDHWRIYRRDPAPSGTIRPPG